MRYSPWVEVDRHPGLLVHETPLEGAEGWWCPEDQVILLDSRLTDVQARCVLAHEVEHMLSADYRCDGPAYGAWFARRQESRADRRAAHKLVDLDELAEAIVLHGQDDARIAETLDVTPRVLRARLHDLDESERAALEHAVARLDDAA